MCQMKELYLFLQTQKLVEVLLLFLFESVSPFRGFSQGSSLSLASTRSGRYQYSSQCSTLLCGLLFFEGQISRTAYEDLSLTYSATGR